MDTARDERMAAAYLPQGNVVSVLYEQHAQIRDLFEEVGMVEGEARRAGFDALRRLLAKHEAAEEVVLRPVTERLLPTGFTRARAAEEQDMAGELAELERMDVDGPEFPPRFRLLEEALWLHASHEETDEFPAVLTRLTEAEQQAMGRWLLRAMERGPVHSHPMIGGPRAAEQPVAGSYAALLIHARERLAATKDEQ